MRAVEPEVFLISRPDLDYDAIASYLAEVGGESWLERLDQGELNDAQNLAELAGRLCYRSWVPRLNPNVTKVRTEQTAYLENILKSLHGSVLEHVNFGFVLHNVSRVLCYDDQTEVLTSDGWVPWPKVDGSEKFGTFNPRTGELQYDSALSLFQGEYDGLMYQVRSEQVDLLVTPRHRMWIQRHDTQAAKRGTQPYEVALANEIVGRRVHYQKTALWRGQEEGKVSLEPTSRAWVRKDTGRPAYRRYPGAEFPLVPFARFLGWYLAEGCLNGHQIVLAQNRGELLDRMASIIREMGLKPYLPSTGDGQVRTQNIALHDFLMKRCGGHAHEKRVPALVHSWGPGAIREFLEAMVDGDGSRRKGNCRHSVIYTTSPELADDLQVLAIKAGWSANIRVDDRSGLRRRIASTGQEFVNRRPCYIVSLVKTRTHPLVNHCGRRHDSWVAYSGKVYCAQVPNGLLFVRRNGKPVISGNTHELIRHRPGVAISQESLRFVRLDELPFWFPDWARQDGELMKRATALLEEMEAFQHWMAGHFGLDEEGVPFHEKKEKTSFMRRLAPDGVATGLVWTANVRTLRHTIEARTAPGAEEEIRLLFGKIGELMRRECPALFGDYKVEDGSWVPEWRKV
jgi:thymidylate synthase ThyX